MENIVDGHQHFWQVGRFDYPWLTSDLGVLYRDYLPRTLAPILKQNQVTSTVLVQASNSLAESRWLLSLAGRYPFIAGVVGWVDLMSSEVEQQLTEFAADPKFKGVRHLVESEANDDWLVQTAVLEGLKTLAAHRMSYDLLVHTRHLPYARTVAETCPELFLVVDHMSKPPIATGAISQWASELRQLAALPRVYCKLSGLVTEANHLCWKIDDLRPFVECALELFGPDRLVFGSDYPVCLLAASYDRVLDSFQELLKDLDDEKRARVFGGNAREFYRLE
ncbi:MAG TPA: amidohydrolase family protein [Pyrinomonadaceae bacterium]|nr:amidohydrolase family protein [Pyrinomonadaceae bacterium]